jgi:hypothetical protein
MNLAPCVRSAVVVALLVLASTLPAAAPAQARGAGPADVVILTYEPAVHDALREGLDSSEPAGSQGAGEESTRWVRGHLQPAGGRPGRYAVALGLVKAPGPEAAEAITRAAIETWRPRYLLLLGTATAASDDDVRGTLVVPRLICEVERERQGSCHRTNRSLLNAALALGSDPGSNGRSKVDDGVSIAGDATDDPAFVRALVPSLLETHRTVLIERGSLGTARAVGAWQATRSDPVGFSIIRGVSALLSDDPAVSAPAPEELERTRRQATESASRFAIELIRRRWPVPPR